MTDAPDSPGQILADADEEVARLARYGHPEAAAVLAGLVARWKVLHEFTIWHDETGAALMAQKSAHWFRARFVAALLVPLQRDAALGRFMRNRLEVVEMGVSGPDYPWGLEVELANGEWHMLTGLHPGPFPDSLDEAVTRLAGPSAPCEP